MKKDLNKIKDEVQSSVVGAKNRYLKQLENSKICGECGNRKLPQSETCQKCYLKSDRLSKARKTKEFTEVFREFLVENSKTYTINELTEIFDMSKPSIYGYVHRGKLKEHIKPSDRGRPINTVKRLQFRSHGGTLLDRLQPHERQRRKKSWFSR